MILWLVSYAQEKSSDYNEKVASFSCNKYANLSFMYRSGAGSDPALTYSTTVMLSTENAPEDFVEF